MYFFRESRLKPKIRYFLVIRHLQTLVLLMFSQWLHHNHRMCQSLFAQSALGPRHLALFQLKWIGQQYSMITNLVFLIQLMFSPSFQSLLPSPHRLVFHFSFINDQEYFQSRTLNKCLGRFLFFSFYRKFILGLCHGSSWRCALCLASFFWSHGVSGSASWFYLVRFPIQLYAILH